VRALARPHATRPHNSLRSVLSPLADGRAMDKFGLSRPKLIKRERERRKKEPRGVLRLRERRERRLNRKENFIAREFPGKIRSPSDDSSAIRCRRSDGLIRFIAVRGRHRVSHSRPPFERWPKRTFLERDSRSFRLSVPGIAAAFHSIKTPRVIGRLSANAL